MRSGLFVLGMMLSSAFGFRLTSHIATANQALNEMQAQIHADGTPSTLHFHDLDLQITFSQAYQAVLHQPDYFRMGSIAPDAFPDLVSGQIYLHPDNAMLHSDASQDVLNDVQFEQRSKPSKYRAIDYAMRLLRQARLTGKETDLSFALGYLAHVSGDGFAHAWVNQQANGYWDMFSGHGAFGPLTEEIKHLAVETFVDDQVPYDLVGTPPEPGGNKLFDKIKLKAPYDLMDGYFKEVVQGEPVGGKIYTYFSFQKDILKAIESGGSGPLNVLESVGGGPGTAASVKWLAGRIPGLGAIFNAAGFSPAEDIANLFFDQLPSFNPASWYFNQIRDNMHNLEASTDVFRRDWMVMSSCSIENLAKHDAVGNPDRCPELGNDANLTYPGMTGANRDLMRRDMEKLFQSEAGKDYHSNADNALRAAKYLIAGFRLQNLPEVLVPADLRKAWVDFKDWLQENDNVIVNVILYVPATAIAEADCIGKNLVCDSKCLINQCSTKILRCIPDREADCVDCGKLDLICIAEAPACVLAAPFFCATEGVIGCVGCATSCAYDDLAVCTADNIFNFNSTRKLYAAVDDLLSPLDQLKAYIVDYLEKQACTIAENAGVPIADIYRVIGIYKTIDALTKEGELGWPNFAFLKEDLQDPVWFAKLTAGGDQIKRVLTDLRDGKTTFIGEELSTLPVDVPANCFKFNTEGAFYKDANFAVILSVRAMFTEPGPTMTRILKEIGPDMPNTFHPFFNTVQMLKLLPLQDARDIEGLIAQQGGSLGLLPWSTQGQTIYSSICRSRTQANLLCDVVPSLDNPDGIMTSSLNRDPRYLRSVTYLVDGKNVTWDWGRSVTPWNDYKPTDPAWKPHTLTSFPLATTDANYDKVFTKIFRVPSILPLFTTFDDPAGLWTAPAGVTVKIDPDKKTQGTGSMQIKGNGYFVLQSPRAKTTDFGVFSENLAMDLWVPAGQPNKSWFGSVALNVDLPAAGIFNEWDGQVELTGLQTGAWNTLRFKLSDNLVKALAGDYPGLVFKLAFNVNPTADPYRLDNFRFDPVLQARQKFHVVGSQGKNISTNDFLGFEKVSDWSLGTLKGTANTTLFTQGRASLGFTGNGWGTLVSRKFSSDELAAASRSVSFDLRIPDPQPNVWWGGEVSLTFSCPSAGLYNVYIGQKSLTNLFWGEFNGIGFNLPDNVYQALLQHGRNDCQWEIATTVSPGSGNFNVDNFGFVNASVRP